MKKLFSLTSLSFLFLSVAQFAYGETTVNTCPTDKFAVLCNLTPEKSLGFIFTAIIVVAILVALFFLIWGGIKWVISGGDKAKVDAARQTIVAAVVGLIIVFLAWFIMNLITQVFFGTNISSLTIPTINIGQ